MTATRRVASVESFDITTKNLGTVLDDIHNGRTRLPHFCREWCWPESHIRSLLGSIAEGHPIGSVMFVEALPLDHRLFDGADSVPDPSVAPVHLVLDGQQRLTAAYRACYARAPVKIKSGSRSEYHLYFFDMAKAVSSESPVEDAIFSIRTKRDGSPLDRDSIDYTDPFIQYEMGLLPTNQLFDFVAYEWAYSDFWDEQEGGPKRSRALQLLHDFEAAIASSFERYKLAVQTLKRPMSVAALCRVYEHVNMPRKNVELVE